MTLSLANYSDVLETPKSRFGNKQQTISHHTDMLANLALVNSNTYLKGLRKHYDPIEENIRGLMALEVSPDSYGTLLAPTLIKNRDPKWQVE